MAALSVHKLIGAYSMSIEGRALRSSDLSSWFAATPPAITTDLGENSSTALVVALTRVFIAIF
jgi:hypothetical protein